MPRYVYNCLDCDSFEERQRTVADRDKPTVCIGCGQLMARVLGVPAVRFVGDGWQTPRASSDDNR